MLPIVVESVICVIPFGFIVLPDILIILKKPALKVQYMVKLSPSFGIELVVEIPIRVSIPCFEKIVEYESILPA